MGKDIEVGGGEYTAKDYQDPPPAPLIDPEELTQWSFYRAIIAEFVATLLFLYITVLTVIGYKSQTDPINNADQCGGVGILGIAWAFGGMIFVLVYCTAGISASLQSENWLQQKLNRHNHNFGSVVSMAKAIRYLSSLIDVAPALFISPHRTSSPPGLETISEEDSEDYDEDLGL